MQALSHYPECTPYTESMARPEAHPFGQRMAKLRQDFGWSQAELGRRLDLSRGMVAYYESCAKNPTLEFVEKVADVFEVSVGDLMDKKPGDSSKRKPGPASRLEQLTSELSKLPKSKQAVVVQMLEAFLHHQTGTASS
jgi:transcriptional regulator with XRE-family HTH domain